MFDLGQHSLIRGVETLRRGLHFDLEAADERFLFAPVRLELGRLNGTVASWTHAVSNDLPEFAELRGGCRPSAVEVLPLVFQLVPLGRELQRGAGVGRPRFFDGGARIGARAVRLDLFEFVSGRLESCLELSIPFGPQDELLGHHEGLPAESFQSGESMGGFVPTRSKWSHGERVLLFRRVTGGFPDPVGFEPPEMFARGPDRGLVLLDTSLQFSR